MYFYSDLFIGDKFHDWLYIRYLTLEFLDDNRKFFFFKEMWIRVPVCVAVAHSSCCKYVEYAGITQEGPLFDICMCKLCVAF